MFLEHFSLQILSHIFSNIFLKEKEAKNSQIDRSYLVYEYNLFVRSLNYENRDHLYD